MHAPCSDLQHGWVIDSGASSHMTPVRKDCKDIYSVFRHVYMADGSSVICKEAGQISIPFNRKNGEPFYLVLKDVLIIPSLDRRLFSVNSFLNKGNNWVQFSRGFIQLGIRKGPNIKIPITSLQSSAMVVIDKEKEKSDTRQRPKKKITSDIIHERFHRGHGAIATIMDEDLWDDVQVTPGQDKFCTSCKVMTIKAASRNKTRHSTCTSFLEEIQVDTVPNPEPLGISNETRCNYFLIFCDRYSRIF